MADCNWEDIGAWGSCANSIWIAGDEISQISWDKTASPPRCMTLTDVHPHCLISWHLCGLRSRRSSLANSAVLAIMPPRKKSQASATSQGRRPSEVTKLFFGSPDSRKWGQVKAVQMASGKSCVLPLVFLYLSFSFSPSYFSSPTLQTYFFILRMEIRWYHVRIVPLALSFC